MQLNYDVVVVGGGFSGTFAAIATAREGLKTLLLEKSGSLCGAPNTECVYPFMGYTLIKADGSVKRLSRGLFSELVDKENELKGFDGRYNTELIKVVLDKMTNIDNLDVLFHSTFTDCVVNDGKIEEVEFVNINGKNKVRAKMFIDASGDAFLARNANCAYKVGREGDSKCQPMTLCFRMGGVEVDELFLDQKRLTEIWLEKQANGEIKNQREDLLFFKTPLPNVLHVNSTRVLLSPVDMFEKSKAEKIAREQMMEFYNFLKENAPSCKNSYLIYSGYEIGVRESFLIDGEYKITKEDVINCTKFEDAVACGNYMIDIHSPDGSGTTIIRIPATKFYTIPYRACVPKGISNLLISGRTICAEHEAQSAFRIMPITASMGESIGVCASEIVKRKIKNTELDSKTVKSLMDKFDLIERE